MKNSRALVMLAFAMLAGLAAVVLASRWLLQTSSSAVTPVADGERAARRLHGREGA
jgi:pilus assembly protein CpaB